jgi:hypothetical protein
MYGLVANTIMLSNVADLTIVLSNMYRMRFRVRAARLEGSK